MSPLVTMLPGVAGGLAVTLVIAARARPAPLHLPAALARLDAHTTVDPTDDDAQRVWDRIVVPLTARAARTDNPWWGIPTVDLDICALSPTRYVARRLVWASGTTAGAVVLLVVAAAGGIGVPAALVPLLIMGAAVAGSVVPVFEVAERARIRRVQCRHSLAVYLDLVVQVRAAGAAPAPALLEAAAVCPAWPFRRIHTCLLYAQHAGQPPWDALAELANRMRVPELADVADIAATAADGAAVKATLAAQAAGLRRSVLADEKAADNTTTQRLAVPAALLVAGPVLLALYSAVIRLLDLT